MVRLSQILRWSDYYNIPKRYLERVKFNGTVIGNICWISMVDSFFSLVFPEGNMNVIPKKTLKYNDPWIYTQDPPWTDLAQRKNDPRQGHRRPQLIEPLKTWDFFRGDVVSFV